EILCPGRERVVEQDQHHDGQPDDEPGEERPGKGSDRRPLDRARPGHYMRMIRWSAGRLRPIGWSRGSDRQDLSAPAPGIVLHVAGPVSARSVRWGDCAAMRTAEENLAKSSKSLDGYPVLGYSGIGSAAIVIFRRGGKACHYSGPLPLALPMT